MADNIEKSPKLVLPTVQSVVLPDPNILSQISPWDLQYHQLEPGRMRVDISMLAGRNLNILSFKSNLGLHQLGGGPKGSVTLGIPISGELPKWRQTDVVPNTLLSFGTGTEFDGISRGSFHGLTFSMSEAYYDSLCDKLGLPQLDKSRGFGLISANVGSSNRKRLGRSVLTMLSEAPPPLTAEVEDELASELLISMTDGEQLFVDKSTPESRTKARKRAIEKMHELAARAPTISEICTESGVGWRTLNRAFLEYFGFGPKTYLKIVRLTRVRNELIANGSEVPISISANRWGFWHMGQFSLDYRRFFHELPSQTKRRAGHFFS